MKAAMWFVGLFAGLLANTSVSYAQSRYLLMEGYGEFGWSINRPSKIDGEAEGRSLALADLNGQLEGMANIEKFEQFSQSNVRNSLSNKYEEIGPAIMNTTTFTREDNKMNAFRGNKRGLVVAVEEGGFKPGTFSNSSDYKRLTGVRKSKASGILLYKFRVYAPEGYNPNQGKTPNGGNGNARPVVYRYRGPNRRSVNHPNGAAHGTIVREYRPLGGGAWLETSLTTWNDGVREVPQETIFQLEKESPGNVFLKSDRSAPLRLSNDGLFMWRTWPGDGYPYSPPNVVQWWRLEGAGSFVN